MSAPLTSSTVGAIVIKLPTDPNAVPTPSKLILGILNFASAELAHLTGFASAKVAFAQGFLVAADTVISLVQPAKILEITINSAQK
jgi:hypothetical protein